MEDGAKEEPESRAQSKEPKFLGKAGWMKKAPGRLLASYKDRFIHVEKTEIVVYENEDLQNCLERVDLENYDKCHELKSPFKRKHRLVLIRSSKPGTKVHDVKFQAQTAEEKEAWIKALVDGINRAKNKVFDEVMVDEGSNLEHVTRSRPKGNRNRRPPTRIHMKEVAVVSSDGILRLDLDLEDAMMPNGTRHTTVDGTETPKEATRVPTPPSNASEAAEKQSGESAEEEETEVSPQKKVIKPPMPPTKEAKPSPPPEDEPSQDDAPEKKVLKPPMPPSKEAKPCSPPVEEATEEAKAEKKKTAPPPTPPNKPSNLPEASPPTPPSKEKKPAHSTVEWNQEVQSEEKEETGADESEVSKDLPSDDESPSAEGRVSGEESEEGSIKKTSDNEPQIPTESLLLTPKKEVQHTDDTTDQDPAASLQTASDTSASSPQAEEAPPKSEVPSVVVTDPVTDGLGLSPLLGHLPGEKKKKKTEEKSVDSGQHSDDDSEGSGGEDTLAASTAALRGSNAGLDVLDNSEDDVQVSISLRPKQAPPKPQVKPKVFPCRRSEPTPPLKPSLKSRSASSGDLLSDSPVFIQPRQQTRAVSGGDAAPPTDDIRKLETEVALEMENTRELMSRVSQSGGGGGDGDGMPEDLLAKAMEKLQKADHVLREVNKLKIARSSSNRKSW